MTNKEKLLSLINEIQDEGIVYGEHDYGVRVDNERLAEHLIQSGVTFKQGGWIPVSLGFTPECFGTFLVTIRDNDPDKTVYTDCADYYPFTKNWLPHGCYSKGREILYWMPLPEPPKGD